MTERYPTFLAGQRLTAALMLSSQMLVARKTADTARASTTTLTDDPELTFELAASSVYLLDGWVKYTATATADIVIDWTIPSGCLGEWTGHGPGLTATAATTDGYLIRADSSDISQSRNYAGIGSASDVGILISGTIRTSSAGTYAMQWAQNATDTIATTVYTDSWLRLQQIA